MSLLNKFTFSINTWACNKFVNVTHPLNDDIRRSFIERKYQHVGFYADDNPLNYSKSFPFLRQPFVRNDEQQKNKQHSSAFVIFPYLRNLNHTLAHIDHVEEFILKKHIHLPCLVSLTIKYQSLISVTHHFTINAIELNFT
ncbi:unnamed protein product [Rotaria socialis]|uniref:Uncharacterized protein n=1 Tax=Rotaria socialis TaxID=392032 RepID=A0A818E7M3_9BILA|nr:unnamed protein product [Rotaria socialis]CAF4616303.1 unnamed protein product [Rotaria socialis]